MPVNKQRSFKRYQIRLVATLVVNNTNYIQCMIRDFCSGGLFLEPLSLDGIEALRPLQTKRILFSVDLKHGGKDFSIDAKIMHILKNGIGVEFKNETDFVFEALKKEAKNTLGLKSADRRENPEIETKQQTLGVELDNLFDEQLPKIVNHFYQSLKETSPELLEKLKEIDQKTTLQKLITKLEKNKNILLNGFCSSIKEIDYLSLPDSEQKHDSDKKKDLSVIENDEFEDWLNILAVARNLESIHPSQLEQLQTKIAYVANVNKNSAINQISPGNLCDCFRKLISKLENSALIRNILYAAFEKTLIELLPGLYKQMDNILVKHGAPIKIEKDSNWTQIKPGSRLLDSASDPIIKSVTDLPAISGQNFSSKNTSYQSKYLHSLEEKPAEQSKAPYTETISAYSAEEIKSAFAEIQKNKVRQKTPQFSSVLLKIELLEILKNSSSIPKQLSTKDLKNLEVFGCFFEIIFKLLSPTKIKQYLYNIYIPMVYHALQNSDFLETDNNPARAILNHYFWLEIALLDDELLKIAPGIESLEPLMEQLSKHSLNHPSTFLVVEQQLNEITIAIKKTVNENSIRVTKVYQGKQKLINAQQSVEEEFNHRNLTDKKIPKIICNLLDAGWQHLLVLAKLNDDNNAFQSHLRIIVNLNGWICGPEKAKKEHIDSTLEFIDIQLQTVCTNAFLHDKILKELTIILEERDLPLNSDAMNMVLLKLSKTINKLMDHLDVIDQFNVGEWFTFLLKQEPEPLKLIWLSDSQEIFVFVNRSGLKRIELKSDAFIDLLNKEHALRIENLDCPLVDRAIESTLQEMHKKLVSNAIYDPLTQLLNKDIFIKQLEQELTKTNNDQHLLCNFQIQDYNLISEDCGLAGVDALKKQLADILKPSLRIGEIITQLDDKTFTILLKNCPVDVAHKVATKFQSRLITTPFNWKERQYSIAVNIGIVPLSTAHQYNIDRLLHKLNTITVSAVTAGSNKIKIYQENEENTSLLNKWHHKINEIFTDYYFFPLCQKIFVTKPKQNSYSHYKILLGIKDKNGNIIEHEDFFRKAENTWSLSEIDHWLILTVFSWIDLHQSVFKTIESFSISLSADSIKSAAFFDFLNQSLSAKQIDSSKITFEIPEVVATENFLLVQEFIKKIKPFKCKFALNDFGSDFYSSHSFLKGLDINYLIITNELTKNIDNNTTAVTLVKSLISIASSLGLETIAESVENNNAYKILSEIGIDYCQGKGLAEPGLLAELVEN